jgi:transposase
MIKGIPKDVAIRLAQLLSPSLAMRALRCDERTLRKYRKRTPIHVRTERKVDRKVQARRTLIRSLVVKRKKVGEHFEPRFPSARALSAELIRRKVEGCVSVKAIRNDLLGFKNLARPQRPTLNHNNERLEFRAYVERCRLTTRVVLYFSDEHFITTASFTLNRRQWVANRSDLLPRQNSKRFGGIKILVWAMIARGYKSELVLLPTTQTNNEGDSVPFRMKGGDYKKRILAKHVVPVLGGKVGHMFQQDGARVHKACVKYLESKKVQLLENWPPYSPDLNCIEEVWPLLDHKISERAPTSEEELREAGRQAWAEIDQGTLDRFVGRFAQKLSEI